MIAKLFIGGLLLVQAVVHSGQVIDLFNETPGMVYASVFVRSCSGAWESIYVDEEMKVPMANPIAVDRNGNYLFFTASPYADVTIQAHGKTISLRNCPISKGTKDANAPTYRQ